MDLHSEELDSRSQLKFEVELIREGALMQEDNYQKQYCLVVAEAIEYLSGRMLDNFDKISS